MFFLFIIVYMSETNIAKIKELMARYHKLQQMRSELEAIRSQLIPLIKQEGLTKTKFDFGNQIIKYSNYNDYGSINKTLIRTVIGEKYPHINAEQFVADLYASRKCKHVETLVSQSKH